MLSLCMSLLHGAVVRTIKQQHDEKATAHGDACKVRWCQGASDFSALQYMPSHSNILSPSRVRSHCMMHASLAGAPVAVMHMPA